MTDLQLTPEEEALLKEAYGYPMPETKPSVYQFFNDIARAKDTTKTGNLIETEIGVPKIPVRTYKNIALFSEIVADKPGFAEYFREKAEIMTATSLSRNALMLRLSVTTKKEVANVTKARGLNKGWFGKKKSEEEEGG